MTDHEFEQMENIFSSLINGQRKQMVKQIDEYGLYNFWSDFLDYLKMDMIPASEQLSYYSDVVISYHRIKNR